MTFNKNYRQNTQIPTTDLPSYISPWNDNETTDRHSFEYHELKNKLLEQIKYKKKVMHYKTSESPNKTSQTFFEINKPKKIKINFNKMSKTMNTLDYSHKSAQNEIEFQRKTFCKRCHKSSERNQLFVRKVNTNHNIKVVDLNYQGEPKSNVRIIIKNKKSVKQPQKQQIHNHDFMKPKTASLKKQRYSEPKKDKLTTSLFSKINYHKADVANRETKKLGQTLKQILMKKYA